MNKNRQRGGRPQGRRPHGNNNAGGGGSHRNFDSNGPDVKIRGTASHIFERYCQLARDANSSGDRVGAENYLQHAEHYYRIMLAQGVTPMQRASGNPANAQAGNGNGQGNGQPQQPQQQPSADGEQPSLEMELEAALDPNAEAGGEQAERDEANAA
ncbi:DUF4167 domain-containing protein [Ferrovibrio sp.]|uniref:DUF4167 domain-containing protein n=1 Tax=Ferrovibrio sp. TaxID=1917215 RepID=UPI00311F3CA5